MKILQLPDVLHEYLVHVVEKHAQQGIHPEEGVAIAHLWEAVTKHVQHIDEKEMMKMAVAGTPDGQTRPLPTVNAPDATLQENVYPDVKE
jgi:hypothetical protein